MRGGDIPRRRRTACLVRFSPVERDLNRPCARGRPADSRPSNHSRADPRRAEPESFTNISGGRTGAGAGCASDATGFPSSSFFSLFFFFFLFTNISGAAQRAGAGCASDPTGTQQGWVVLPIANQREVILLVTLSLPFQFLSPQIEPHPTGGPRVLQQKNSGGSKMNIRALFFRDRNRRRRFASCLPRVCPTAWGRRRGVPR